MASITNALLTIAIPTYNRPAKVLKTVEYILPQLNDQVTVLIIDNFSEIDINSYLSENLTWEQRINIEVKRNFVNLGPDANFAKCFEYCSTSYIWTLSDDDFVEPDAVSLILSEIERYKDDNVIWFNFGSNYTHRNHSEMSNNLIDLVKKADNFENLLLLSTSVYNRNEYIKHLRWAYWGAYSMASQLIPALILVANNSNAVLSKWPIVQNLPGERTEKWPDAQQALAISSILEAPLKLKKDDHSTLGHFLMKNIETFPRVFCDIILAVNFDVSKIDSYHRYIYKKIYKNTIAFRRNKIQQEVLYRLYYLLLITKPLTKLILKTSLMKRYVLTSSKFSLFCR